MPSDSAISALTRRGFLSGASTLVGSLVVASKSPAVEITSAGRPPAADYPILVDTTQKPIHYSAPGVSDASALKVAAGKVVSWSGKTSGARHHLTVVFKGDTPFLDAKGDPIYAFFGSQDDEPNGIGATLDPGADGEYCYCVVVCDEDGKKAFFDDPKIIVGNGLSQGRAQIDSALRLLQKAVQRNSSLKTQIDPIEVRLRHVAKTLR